MIFLLPPPPPPPTPPVVWLWGGVRGGFQSGLGALGLEGFAQGFGFEGFGSLIYISIYIYIYI